MKQPKDKNFGKSPFDPDYRDDYDPEKDYESWLDEKERKEQEKRER